MTLGKLAVLVKGRMKVYFEKQTDKCARNYQFATNVSVIGS